MINKNSFKFHDRYHRRALFNLVCSVIYIRCVIYIDRLLLKMMLNDGCSISKH